MSKFKVWIDTPTDNNCMSAEDFSADSQVKEGFKAGTSSSSIRVNSGLRQANLVTSALMNIVDTEEELDLRSDVNSVETKINSYFDNRYRNGIINDYDKSKGTIEERLTSLGFKEGAVTLEEFVINETVTLNKLYRQGNYVIGEFYAPRIELGIGAENIFKLPNEFIPKDKIIRGHVKTTIYYSDFSSDTDWRVLDLPVSDDGVVSISNNGTLVAMYIHFGYEANPIE